MNVLWNKQVEISDLWTPDCFGLFSKEKKKVTFFFKNRNNLLSISEENTKPQLLYSCSCNETLPLPLKWAVVETPNSAFVLVSDDRGYNLKSNEFSYDVPTQLRMAYNQHLRPAKYYEEAPQHLGELTILHKGNCGYICKRDNSKLWEFTGRAYLYTDMMRWKDRLFFGTGGYGGYFYVLDIHNGLPLVSIKTGGTRCIVQVDNLCYILKNENNAQLLCIDLFDGRTVSQCELPGVATLDSRITMIDNHIHAITFHISRSKLDGFTWSCVKI